jgi:hypothetical protein
VFPAVIGQHQGGLGIKTFGRAARQIRKGGFDLRVFRPVRQICEVIFVAHLRDCHAHHIAGLRELRSLVDLGFPVAKTRPRSAETGFLRFLLLKGRFPLLGEIMRNHRDLPVVAAEHTLPLIDLYTAGFEQTRVHQSIKRR